MNDKPSTRWSGLGQSTLSDLEMYTAKYYDEAGKQKFIQILQEGELSSKLYAIYLWNLHKKYDLLETIADGINLFEDLHDLKRKSKALEDYNELWNDDEPAPILNSTNEYIKHFREVMHDNIALLGHMYALYIGNLEHGDYLSAKVPGEGRLFQYDTNTIDLKQVLDTKIETATNNVRHHWEAFNTGIECAYCFESSIELRNELMELDI